MLIKSSCICECQQGSQSAACENTRWTGHPVHGFGSQQSFPLREDISASGKEEQFSLVPPFTSDPSFASAVLVGPPITRVQNVVGHSRL
ncbi:UNVERIFIED_CONTAM: hypothetical protein K2H54_053545 [Gekko kuhli]